MSDGKKLLRRQTNERTKQHILRIPNQTPSLEKEEEEDEHREEEKEEEEEREEGGEGPHKVVTR